MNREALFSDGTKQFLVPSEPNKNEVVTIRFRTAKNDADFVRVISGSRAFVMQKAYSEGVFDYYGKEQLIRNKIINILKQTFENYGYSPLDSSVLYNYDILAYKYQDGAEILNEIYTLTDQGNRQLGLRYDLTVPLVRYYSKNANDLPPIQITK